MEEVEEMEDVEDMDMDRCIDMRAAVVKLGRGVAGSVSVDGVAVNDMVKLDI